MINGRENHHRLLHTFTSSPYHHTSAVAAASAPAPAPATDATEASVETAAASTAAVGLLLALVDCLSGLRDERNGLMNLHSIDD